MSFTALNDKYQNMITHINELIEAHQVKIDANNAAIALLQQGNANTYAVTLQRIATFNEAIQSDTNNISILVEMRDEIDTILALSDEDKAQLAYFYSVIQTDMNIFVCKLMFNVQSALTNDDINRLMQDTETPSETKVAIAQLIYDQYSIDIRVMRNLLPFSMRQRN